MGKLPKLEISDFYFTGVVENEMGMLAFVGGLIGLITIMVWGVIFAKDEGKILSVRSLAAMLSVLIFGPSLAILSTVFFAIDSWLLLTSIGLVSSVCAGFFSYKYPYEILYAYISAAAVPLFRVLIRIFSN